MSDTNKPASTPGPWRAASKPSAVVGWPVISIHGRSICSVAYRNNWNLPDSAERGEATANAALIAAAPDLYEALDEAINYLAIYALWRSGDKKAKEILDKCTTVLARARGEQP
jgi:hypothetical protein